MNLINIYWLYITNFFDIKKLYLPVAESCGGK
jgi:hypothetical protein